MKILVVGGYTPTLKWHRLDMIRDFVDAGYEVVAMGDAPESEWRDFFAENGARYRQYYTDRCGTNPIKDLKMLGELEAAFREERPDKVFVYHTKPNVYGSMAAHRCGISELYSMVGGVGSVFNSKGLKAKAVRTILLTELRAGLRYAKKVFVQNRDDESLLVDRGVLDPKKVVSVDGSGVNTDKFAFSAVPDKSSFLFVGRLVRGKGVMEYLEAARLVKARFPEAQFHLVGPFDSNATSLGEDSLRPYVEDGTVIYHGEQDDVRPFLRDCSVFVFPSYYGEGVPKCALEAMSVGRAIVAADAIGSREVVKPGVNGTLVAPRSSEELANAMALFCENPSLTKKYGEASRRYALERFDVRIVNRTICETMGIR